MTMARKPKTNKDQTLDNFHVSGTDKLDLAEVIGRQTDNTRVYHKRGSELTWYCITTNGVEDVMKACPADPMKSGSGRFMKLSALKQKGSPVAHWPAELYEEATVINRIFIGLTDDAGEFRIFPVTARIGSDFAGIGITGSAAQRASYHLLGLVAEQTEDRYVTLVTRVQPDKAGDIEKVITMRSDGYAYIPQDEALALASDVCADGDIVYWDVTNFFTEAVYQFPKSAVNTTFGRKKGEFMPYIRYTTSDAGDSSCAFELGWEINGRSVFLASGAHRVFRTHRGEWNQPLRDSLYADAIKLKDKFVILADRMKELSTITVLNENIERAVKNLCSDAKITGKAIQEAFIKHVSNEFAGTDATAAEIVLSMIEAQDVDPVLCDLSDIQKVALKHKLGEVPYQRIRQKV